MGPTSDKGFVPLEGVKGLILQENSNVSLTRVPFLLKICVKQLVQRLPYINFRVDVWGSL